VEAPEGASVAAVLPPLPGPLCGMGVCMGCRVTIDGRAHQLACQTLVRDGMEVTTP
jgi:predicted molibdopterin-dependent oxidoreductase YjgC